MTPEEAETLWQANCLKRLEWLSERVNLNPIDKEYIGFQMKDFLYTFKSSLREEIEKEIKKMPEAAYHREVSGLKRALELLDTITPKQ